MFPNETSSIHISKKIVCILGMITTFFCKHHILFFLPTKNSSSRSVNVFWSTEKGCNYFQEIAKERRRWSSPWGKNDFIINPFSQCWLLICSISSKLTVFTEGPPSKGRVLRWLSFLALGPTALTLGLYTLYVGPRIRYVSSTDVQWLLITVTFMVLTCHILFTNTL